MKKQDTAMELLLARIDKMQSNNIEVVKIYAKELLKVEKEQINEAYELGCRTAADDISSRI